MHNNADKMCMWPIHKHKKIHMSENDSMYCNTDNIDSDICIKINIINYSSSSDCESVSLEASV